MNELMIETKRLVLRRFHEQDLKALYHLLKDEQVNTFLPLYPVKNREETLVFYQKHIVYNKCPHLGCSLIFNEFEKTWDCPCHGSKFDIDGNCLRGPSKYNISYKK